MYDGDNTWDIASDPQIAYRRMLLQWVQLEPLGPLANLAAVRFSSPVRVRSLKIFPTGARPFNQQNDIIAYVHKEAYRTLSHALKVLQNPVLCTWMYTSTPIPLQWMESRSRRRQML